MRARLKNLLAKHVGHYVRLSFTVASSDTTETAEGFLEEVNDEYLILTHPDGSVVVLSNITVYAAEILPSKQHATLGGYE